MSDQRKIDFDPTCPAYVEKIEKRLSYTVFVDEFTPPSPDDTCIMGTYSRSWRNKKHREVLKRKAVELYGRKDSPTAHVRDYLMFCYPRRPAKKEQRDILKRKHMPIYADPCIVRDAVYVDLRSAWFSICLLVGWNVEYYPGLWFGKGQPPLDFPLKDNKVARSSMTSMGRSGAIPVWHKGKVIYQKMYNSVENFHIFAVIADVLNLIALKAISLGARYVNTDGYIIHKDKAKPLIDYINGWTLDARIKAEGCAVIAGVGAYHIGDHKTGRGMEFHPIDTIDRTVDESFLRPRVLRQKITRKVLVF